MLKILLILSLGIPFQIKAQEWAINKDHSEILFQVAYLSVSEVSGRFTDFSGRILQDGAGFKELELVIHSASIDTSHKTRDTHLKSAEFFQSAKWPDITFKSHEISGDGTRFKTQGMLQIRDVIRPIELTFTVSKMIKDTWGFQNRFITFKSHIKRSDFGLKWNKTLADNKLLVGDDVTFSGTLQIQPAVKKTPTSKHMIPDTKYIRERERYLRGEITKDELDKKFAPDEVSSAQEVITAAEGGPVALSVMSSHPEERGIWWWIAFCTMGFLGFVAVIVISFYSKSFLIEHFPKKYDENGMLGYATDVLVMLYVVIYSVAFWFVGWGVR